MSRGIDSFAHVPGECVQDALFFVQRTSEDVKNYEFLRKMKTTPPSAKADCFCAWWNLHKFESCPHALIMLHDAEEEIDEEFGDHTVQNVIQFLQHRLIGYYDLLKAEDYIEDAKTEEK